MKTIDVRYELDEERGLWAVFAEGVPSGHSQGRSVREARNMIREAVALVLEIDTDDVAVGGETFVLAGTLDRVVASAQAAKAAAETADREARVARERAVAGLRAAGLTVRDAGEILGISFQRVQQVSGPTKKRVTKRKSVAKKKAAARARGGSKHDSPR